MAGEPLERAVESGRRRALEIVERSSRRRAGTRGGKDRRDALPVHFHLPREEVDLPADPAFSRV